MGTDRVGEATGVDHSKGSLPWTVDPPHIDENIRIIYFQA